ncbi:MAG TPA: hypothetical protein VMV07_27460, partial [Streptosporangiaceae bacterium]|nr:hypothetical protein [Streptosporangiaceae bacterium]
AERLAALVPDSRVLDPETVGQFLRVNLGDLPVPDFQDWPAWRSLVAATIIEVARMTGQHVIAPQTVLKREYLDQIFAPLRAAELEVFHVVLDAADAVLRSRIEGSDEAREWRLAHLDEYRTARPWMVESADFVVDTAASTPPQIARRIIAALPDLPDLPEVAVPSRVTDKPMVTDKPKVAEKPALEDQLKAGLPEKPQAAEQPGLADHR